MQLLFQLDLNPTEDLDGVFEAFWPSARPMPTLARSPRVPCEECGVGLEVLDGLVAELAEHWDIRRMGVIERNVIRLAVYEMLHRPISRRWYPSTRPSTSPSTSAARSPGASSTGSWTGSSRTSTGRTGNPWKPRQNRCRKQTNAG